MGDHGYRNENRQNDSAGLDSRSRTYENLVEAFKHPISAYFQKEYCRSGVTRI